MYRAIDLFAGIGGIRLGFQRAFGSRIKFVFANEINDQSCETYEANFGHSPKGDITKIDPKELPQFNLLLGGFPCQAFSIAGRKRGFADTRGTLFFYVAEIIRQCRPQALLLENVKNLRSHDKGRTFRVIYDVLTRDLGYTVYHKVLNAKHYGIPQNRERIFIVGFRDPIRFEFPAPCPICPPLHTFIKPYVPAKFYLSQKYWLWLQKHRARHEARGNGFGYVILDMNGCANALVCGGMGHERNLVHGPPITNMWKKGDPLNKKNNANIRKMTPREWARLQGFPDEFKFPVAMTHQYKQLGNSVAVPVVEAIAHEMLRTLTDRRPAPRRRLEEYL